MHGEHTYIEIFSPREKASVLGLGFGTERRGEIAAAHAQVLKVNPKVGPVESVKYEYAKDNQRPWFQKFPLEPESADREIWVMESEPSFLAEIFKENYDGKSIDRKTYLHRLYKPDRMMRNITRVKIETSSSDMLIKELRAMNFQVVSPTTVSDGMTKIEIVQSAMPRGLIEVDFAVQGGSKLLNQTMGSSKLIFKGDRLATWMIFPEP